MTWLRFPRLITLVAGFLTGSTLPETAHAADPVVLVEPADLARRPDLIGREVIVDDRIRYFLESKRGQGFDELILKRTDVPCRLGVGSRFLRTPSEPNAVVRGTLKQVDGRLLLDVLTLELQPNDIARLDHEISRLRPGDFADLRKWALWAERRGLELSDAKLEAKGIALETDALWMEAGRPGADVVALADQAENRPVPVETREALYHRGLRQAAERATTAPVLDSLARRAQTIFPRAIEPKAATAQTLKPTDDPAALYRDADPLERVRLNRQLYADLIEKSLNLRLAADPTRGIDLVEEADRLLPDRPEVAARFRQRGLAEAERQVTAMRQSEVEELARTFRESGQPDRARKALEEWLADRRQNRLSATDAEGRVLLAANYEKLLGDRVTAGELLTEAERVDPASPAIADAFLRLGFRKGDAGWYDPTTPPPVGSAQPGPAPANFTESNDPENALQGLTRSQARSRMGGKPDRVVRAATQGITIEQWLYRTGRNDQYVIFRIDATTTEPRVTASYSIPQSANRP